MSLHTKPSSDLQTVELSNLNKSRRSCRRKPRAVLSCLNLAGA